MSLSGYHIRCYSSSGLCTKFSWGLVWFFSCWNQQSLNGCLYKCWILTTTQISFFTMSVLQSRYPSHVTKQNWCRSVWHAVKLAKSLIVSTDVKTSFCTMLKKKQFMRLHKQQLQIYLTALLFKWPFDYLTITPSCSLKSEVALKGRHANCALKLFQNSHLEGLKK